MWLETSIDLYNQEEVDLGLDPTFNKVRLYINVNPKTVLAVRETIDNGNTTINNDECFLYMHSKEKFIVKENYEKILKILKDEQNSDIQSRSSGEVN